jgi:hypothetical protein
VEGESVKLVVRNPPRTDRALVEGLAEARSRERYAKGELSLDVNAMRDALAAKGLTYVDAAQ